MNEDKLERLVSYIQSLDSRVKCVCMKPSDLIFEENVKMNCYYCGKYNNNWRCPPNLPNVDFPKLMTEYENGLFLIMQFEILSDNFSAIRSESSIVLHKLLLDSEKWLWNNNDSTAISFIGGSCKLCKNGCGKDRCNNPYMSRSPLEATGVNIIKSVKKYNIEITFPVTNMMMRIGLLLW